MSTAIETYIALQNRKEISFADTEKQEIFLAPLMVSGYYKKLVKLFLWLNIYIIACKKYINPYQAFVKLQLLARLRDAYSDKQAALKYAKVDKRFFFAFNAPGWPSKAFNRYIEHNLSKFEQEENHISLHTVILGITKKCGYKCEHCFEWDNLNQPETLSKDDLFRIIERFQQLGVTQFQLSGGEPLNRLDDILEIAARFRSRSDFWIYTSGHLLTEEKARKLKAAGVTGVAISIDHWRADKHDLFRGKKNAFNWAQLAAINAVNAGLTVCLSLCATSEFITEDNLYRYAHLALALHASFIQVLEPKAVGHYAGMDVSLTKEQLDMLDTFYLRMNYERAFKNYPMVIYHGFYTRRIACAGSGQDYLYVDMDGFAHACPFCQTRSFHVLKDDLEMSINQMRTKGCGLVKTN